MKRFTLLSTLLLLLFEIARAQSVEPKSNEVAAYRTTSEKINNLVHTKLDAKFDYAKSQLNGKVWITLKPHFYTTDSLLLDAKGMDIKQVAIVKNGKNNALKYGYDGMFLNINLDRPYKRSETYTIYIDYIAKPDEYAGKGSAAITDAKGLYFINPRGEDKNKPTQIWTQGETEATSVYVPTIDKPNQKTTQEFILTVPAKYVSLSNGKLVSQKPNSDGTRTDHWKMELPHAPYLFFIGVGDYAIIKDSYKGKEVSYYVEKEYASVARKIFGATPEMIKYFSMITGVDYPWVKYAQIVGRDYVSGAMENTTATLHQESAYQNARELVDGNRWEETIAHEVFHQWFGNYVTAESWSNLTVNESFATMGSQLWNEYKYGKDAGDAERYNATQGYINSSSERKDLVRYTYNDKEDVFDAVSYNKGAAILQMLRNQVGDSAFFKSLNNYLVTNKFKAAEAHQLRLAFEEVTGKDLNPFFNQWYLGSGHPRFDINYNYDESKKQAKVIVKQTQSADNLFQLPVAIDVYNGTKKTRYNVWINNQVDTFVFASSTKPDLVNFDGDKILIAQKTENKTLDNYIHQYKYAGNYIDRREAIDAAAKKQEEIKGVELLTMALNDKYHELRNYSISKLDLRKEGLKAVAEPILADLAKNDKKSTVRGAAIGKLGEYKQGKYSSLFKNAINDSSYTVAGNALEALGKVDSVTAYNEAKRLSTIPAEGQLARAITSSMIKYGDESAGTIILDNFEKMAVGQEKFEALQPLTEYLMRVKSMEIFKRGVDDIVAFNAQIPEAFRDQVTSFIDGLLKNVQKAKQDAGQKDMADYVSAKLTKKGFVPVP